MTHPPSLTIWHLISNRWNSAITEYALCAAKSLQSNTCQNIFICRHGTPAAQRARQYGLRTIESGQLGPRELTLLRRLVAESSPDYLCTYGGSEMFLAQLFKGIRLIKRRFSSADSNRKVPVLVRFRGYQLPAVKRRRWLRRLRLQLGHLGVDGFLTPAEIISVRLRGIARVAVITVPLGRDATFFCRSSAIDRPARPELLILGRLDPIKGHRYLLQTFKRVLDNWDEAEAPLPLLYMAGEPANLGAEDIRRLAEQAQVEKRHYLLTTKRLDNPAAHLSKATVGVIASLGSEVICRVAEEFLLCGTPIIVSGVGALEETLFPGAGTSYRGLSDEAVARLLQEALVGHWLEANEVRISRANKAQERYSLPVMGSRLRLALRHIEEASRGA